MAIGSSSGRIRLIEPRAAESNLLDLTHDERAREQGETWAETAVTSLEFSPDGQRLAGAVGRDVRVWQMPGGKPAFAPLQHPHGVLHLAFHPVGEILATADADNSARFWEMDSGREIREPLRHSWGAIRYVAFHPDGERVATFGEDANLRLWTWKDGRMIAEYYVHQGGIMGGFFDSGRFLLGLGEANHFFIEQIEDGNPRPHVRGFYDVATFAAIHPDGLSLAVGCRDRALSIWPVPPIADVGQMQAHRDAITQIAYHRNGRWLATASLDGRARLWSTRQGGPASPSLPHGSAVNGLAFHPVHPQLVTADQEGAATRFGPSGAVRIQNQPIICASWPRLKSTAKAFSSQCPSTNFPGVGNCAVTETGHSTSKKPAPAR